MDDNSLNIVRSLQDERQIQAFTKHLGRWLEEDLAQSHNADFLFTDSRARALLVSANLLDGATLSDFSHLVKNESNQRIILNDLLEDTGLASSEQVTPLLVTAQVVGQGNGSGDESPAISWLALIIGSYAWKSGYPINQLDPSSPPGAYTPAGQVLKRSAGFVRRQLQRSATERERLAQSLSQPPSSTVSLDELTSNSDVAAPMPPHYRPPVPENYPEVASETIQVDPDESGQAPLPTTRSPLIITESEIEDDTQSSTEVVRMPPITIDAEQFEPDPQPPPSPLPSSAVVVPTDQASQSRPSLTVALRQMLQHEQLSSTKLKVLVQQYPDGPGLYGLQVRVSCKGVKSYVAGTTDRDGRFVSELPVRVESGLTYDVEVTWPRDEGGEVERKSITMNADRTHFTLPFYRLLYPPDAVEDSTE
jgi:hypothetical protein